MTFRWLYRFDKSEWIVRLIRITWRRGNVGDGDGYSAKFTVAASRRLFRWLQPELFGWRITICGLRLHYVRAYGGIFPR